MKYALALLLILAMGFFASQSIQPVHGYYPTIKDRILLQNIASKVDMLVLQNPNKLLRIQKKIPLLQDMLKSNSREHYVLGEILSYIMNKNIRVAGSTKQEQKTSRNKKAINSRKQSWSRELANVLYEQMILSNLN